MQKTHLYKRCLRALLVMTLVLAMPLVSLAESFMVVMGGSLNLRKEPSYTAEVIGQYPTGTWMTVVGQDGDWSKVTVNGKSGYVLSQYLGDGMGAPGTAYVRTNTGANLNMRTQPSLQSDIIGSFKNGTAVTVKQQGAGWCQVELNGTLGYMASRYLSTSAGGSGGSDTTGYPKQGVVKNPGANQVLLLREKASTDARVIGYFGNGTSVTLKGESGSFYKVTVGGKDGYMMKKFIKVTSSSEGGSSTLPTAPFTAKLVNPNGNSIVNFRSAPGLNASIIKAYPVGTEITVTAVGDVWCKAEIDGVSGYVSSYFFKVVK
ncbi:MAG: SH3 domain-containing protein [Clostridia bacterium]